MKLLAFYLPQYHEFPENNEWWGKGFTEWVNVKKAKPLFKGHYQPKVPLDNNYYCLDDVDVMRKQAQMASSYGIDGFCFYHYWFNGKLLMEKPVERFLENKDINIEYCFSWANEPWTRSWDGKNRFVLMPQTYSGVNDIINHFKYLLPFFKDQRYLKIDNKPVFFIYRCNSISYLDDMIRIWTNRALDEGFNGIYFIETMTGFQKVKYSSKTDAIVYMEPMFAIGKKSKFQKLLTSFRDLKKLNRREKYNSVWNRVLRLEHLSEKQNAGAFVDWDNSARKKKKNLVLTDGSIEKFAFYFQKQYEKAQKSGCPFLLINAWNEWAEGTYLEPDEIHKYGYLEAIKKTINSYEQ